MGKPKIPGPGAYELAKDSKAILRVFGGIKLVMLVLSG